MPRFPRLATIVLAAGGSTRMGRPKMLLPVGGRTLLAAAREVAAGLVPPYAAVIAGSARAGVAKTLA